MGGMVERGRGKMERGCRGGHPGGDDDLGRALLDAAEEHGAAGDGDAGDEHG